MAAKENKCGDVPAHDEDTNSHTHDGRTQRVYIAQVFRCQEKRFGSEAFHQNATDGGKQNNPEYEQYLVLSKMKEQEL